MISSALCGLQRAFCCAGVCLAWHCCLFCAVFKLPWLLAEARSFPVCADMHIVMLCGSSAGVSRRLQIQPCLCAAILNVCAAVLMMMIIIEACMSDDSLGRPCVIAGPAWSAG